MKKTTLVFLLVLSFSSLFASESDKVKLLRGHVVDDQGEPIVGAKVVVEGIETTLYTDFEGEFTLNSIPKTSLELKISMVSFEDNSSTVNLQHASSTEEISITLDPK